MSYYLDLLNLQSAIDVDGVEHDLTKLREFGQERFCLVVPFPKLPGRDFEFQGACWQIRRPVEVVSSKATVPVIDFLFGESHSTVITRCTAES